PCRPSESCGSLTATYAASWLIVSESPKKERLAYSVDCRMVGSNVAARPYPPEGLRWNTCTDGFHREASYCVALTSSGRTPAPTVMASQSAASEAISYPSGTSGLMLQVRSPFTVLSTSTVAEAPQFRASHWALRLNAKRHCCGPPPAISLRGVQCP